MPPGISLSDFYYILPELVLTAGALLVLIADVLLPRGERRVAGVGDARRRSARRPSSLVPFAGTHVEVAHGLMAVDGFALFFKVLFLLAAALTVLMSSRYLEIEGARPGEYYFLILCATLGMMFMAAASTSSRSSSASRRWRCRSTSWPASSSRTSGRTRRR